MSNDIDLNGCYIEPTVPAGSSDTWIIHVDRDGKVLCGSKKVFLYSRDPMTVNCEACKDIIFAERDALNKKNHQSVDHKRLISIIRNSSDKDQELTNLERRRWLWNHRSTRGPELGHDLRDSLPYPFEPSIQMIFDGKDTLEIGPGNGRQYERVRDRTKSYCICDISQGALDEPVFNSADGRFLIESWSQTLGRTFDLIHFWYVLHHIRLDELINFFDFVSRHLRDDGLVAFNSPQLINVQHELEGNGEGTTYTDPVLIKTALRSLEMLMALPVDRKSTGFVMLLRKSR